MTFSPTSWPGASPGGGGSVGPSVGIVGAVQGSQPDLTTVATHGLVWGSFVDNFYDLNTLGALPAGLGLTIVADSVTSLILTTEAGTWSFTGRVSLSTDASYQGQADIGLGLPASIDPRAGAAAYILSWTLQLPAAAQLALTLSTTNPPAASPYRPASPSLAITRLA